MEQGASADNTDAAKPLSGLVEGGTIVMLMTMIGDDHTPTRPLSVAEVSGDRLGFLVDATTEWATAISDGSATVHATVCDVRKNHYLSLAGAASIRSITTRSSGSGTPPRRPTSTGRTARASACCASKSTAVSTGTPRAVASVRPPPSRAAVTGDPDAANAGPSGDVVVGRPPRGR